MIIIFVAILRRDTTNIVYEHGTRVVTVTIIASCCYIIYGRNRLCFRGDRGFESACAKGLAAALGFQKFPPLPSNADDDN